MTKSIRKVALLVPLLVVTFLLMKYLREGRTSINEILDRNCNSAANDLVDDRYPKGEHIRVKENYTTVFHQYDTRVDLRVIVLTYNRPKSLSKCLKSLSSLVTDGYRVAMDIWIDVDETLRVDGETLKTAASFNWTQGPVTVWVHSKHVGLFGQWIYTWRPVTVNKTATPGELALYVEDDVDISPYAYRFLRHLHGFYSSDQNISVYALQDISQLLQQKKIRKPRNDPIFMHTLPGTWGMAPRPERWAEFQDWFHKQSQVPGFRPYVDKAEYHTNKYKDLEKKGRQNTLWSMWFIYFMESRKLYSVFSNLPTFIGKPGCSLSSNRREKGLHFNGQKNQRLIPRLLTYWDPSVVKFPKTPKLYDYQGKLVNNTYNN